MLIFALRLEPFALCHFETSNGRVIGNDLLCVVLIMISLADLNLIRVLKDLGNSATLHIDLKGGFGNGPFFF
jgi:hypothetical protein